MPWETNDDVDQYRRDVAKFFERIATLSEANEPPGANAANGWFIKAVRDDQEIKKVAPPRGTADDPEAEQIFSLLNEFETKVVEAFNFENYDSGWHKSSRLALKVLDELKDKIGPVIADIVRVVNKDVTAIGKLVEDTKALIDKIHNSGLVYEGAHANGWIQPAVKEAATKAHDGFAQIVANKQDSLAHEFARAMVEITKAIKTIPDFENKPWLYGDWQISIQAIMRAGATTLYAIRAPADPAA
jgi:hypothetical protein